MITWFFAMGCGSKTPTVSTDAQQKVAVAELDFFQANPSWTGATQLKEEYFLAFSVEFSVKEGSISGAISIPAQNASNIPLDDIHFDGGLQFTLKSSGMPKMMWARYSFDSASSEDRMVGELRQSGQRFPTTLNRGETLGPNRPQTPRGPFPYLVEEVEFQRSDASAHFTGSLTIPTGAESRWPVAILITGSGSQDRDETIFEHQPFWVIADHLSRSGVAVLRVDDRGVGGSTGDVSSTTTIDFAGDVQAGLDYLSSHPKIDSQKMGLIGHSEGGLIAAIVASQRDDLSFVVMMAGSGVNGLETLVRQNHDILKTAGATDEYLQRYEPVYREAMDLSLEGQDEQSAVEALIDIQLELGGTVSAEQRSQAIDMLKGSKDLPWMRTFLTLEPKDYLSKVACPVLALNGSLDVQVAADVHLPAIESALKAGGNNAVTIVRLEGVNHLFQQATTGSIEEYGIIEETINPEVLELIRIWLLDLHSQE